MLRFVIAGVLIASASAAYPTTYPFENEAYVPENLPASTPSLTYDDTDVGGYFFTYHYNGDLHQGTAEMPYAFTANGCWAYGFVKNFGAPPVLSVSTWNCSLKGIFFGDDDFTGLVNGDKVCDVGSCCSEYVGKVKYSDDQMDWHTWLNDKSAAGLCGDVPEAEYCIYVAGNFNVNCFEYILSVTERLVTFPCHDNANLFWLSCQVFKSMGWNIYYVEPPIYEDLMTVEQSFTSQAMVLQPDRVCHPYSYYNPASSASSASSGKTSSISSSISSSSAAMVFTLGIFGLLL